MKPVCVEINDKMQKGYVYWRTRSRSAAIFARDSTPI